MTCSRHRNLQNIQILQIFCYGVFAWSKVGWIVPDSRNIFKIVIWHSFLTHLKLFVAESLKKSKQRFGDFKYFGGSNSYNQLWRYLSNIGPLLQKFHKQVKFLVCTHYCYTGSSLGNQEPKLDGDVSVRCDNGMDCPIGLICKKNTCTKPGSSSVHEVKGKHK